MTISASQPRSWRTPANSCQPPGHDQLVDTSRHAHKEQLPGEAIHVREVADALLVGLDAGARHSGDHPTLVLVRGAWRRLGPGNGLRSSLGVP